MSSTAAKAVVPQVVEAMLRLTKIDYEFIGRDSVDAFKTPTIWSR